MSKTKSKENLKQENTKKKTSKRKKGKNYLQIIKKNFIAEIEYGETLYEFYINNNINNDNLDSLNDTILMRNGITSSGKKTFNTVSVRNFIEWIFICRDNNQLDKVNIDDFLLNAATLKGINEE